MGNQSGIFGWCCGKMADVSLIEFVLEATALYNDERLL